MLRIPYHTAASMTTIEDQLRRDLSVERQQHNETCRRLAASISQTERWKRRAIRAETALERIGIVLESHANGSEA